MTISDKLRDTLERSAFGVCTYLGDKMRLSPVRVRMYFIYISCITLGSPFIAYLFVAFWLNVKRYIHKGRHITWQ